MIVRTVRLALALVEVNDAVAGQLIDGDSRVGEERLIGGDTGLAAVMARARIVARSAAPVLLFGETGTGTIRLSNLAPTFTTGSFLLTLRTTPRTVHLATSVH